MILVQFGKSLGWVVGRQWAGLGMLFVQFGQIFVQFGESLGWVVGRHWAGLGLLPLIATTCR